jgi:gliding motility-associated-like protein
MVTDTAGCTATDTVVVEPCVTVQVTIPNAFTPNSDGVNDRFRVVSSNPELISAYEIIIYNRWGQQIYTSKDPGNGWDGTMNGNPCTMDVYAYTIIYTVTEPRIESKKISGRVALIR